MRNLELTHREWEPKVRECAPSMIGIDDDVLGLKEGEPFLVQTTEWGCDPELLRALARFLRFTVKFQGTKNNRSRMSGIKAANEYFGTVPPNPTRKRYACRDGRLWAKSAEMRALLEPISVQAWSAFQNLLPAQAQAHEEIVEANIHPDWLIAGTPFTSGIINDKAALPYHKDSGNIHGTWSMMVSVRFGVDGGALCMPNYDLTLGIPHGSLTIFNGAETWHGVTPLVMRTKDAYRFTLVWYVKRLIADCGCRDDEPRRASKAATIIHDEYAE